MDPEARKVLKAKIDAAKRELFPEADSVDAKPADGHHKSLRSVEVDARARAWARRALAEDPQLAWAARCVFDEVASR